MREHNERFVRWLRRFSLFAGVAVIAAGVLVLIGWTLDIRSFTSLDAGKVPMNPLTALTFIFAGSSLLLLRREAAPMAQERVARSMAFFVCLIGSVRLIGYIVGGEVGIDQILFHDKLEAGAFAPNRMAPTTALNFLLLGLAILLIDLETKRGVRPSQAFSLIAAAASAFVLIGYIYDVRELYGVMRYIPMALNTNVAFQLLALGALARGQRTDSSVL